MLPLVFLVSRRPVCRTSGFTASMWAKSEGSGLGRSGAGLNPPQIRLEPAPTSPHTGQKPKPAQTRHEPAHTSPHRPETQKSQTQDRPSHPFSKGAKRNPTGQNTHHIGFVAIAVTKPSASTFVGGIDGLSIDGLTIYELKWLLLRVSFTRHHRRVPRSDNSRRSVT